MRKPKRSWRRTSSVSLRRTVARAFRPKKRRRESNREERGHRAAAAQTLKRSWERWVERRHGFVGYRSPKLPDAAEIVASLHDPQWPVGRTAEDGTVY